MNSNQRTLSANPELLNAIQQLSVDDQLGLFWEIYKEMGEAITPAAPGASTASPAIAEAMIERIKQMTPEEQLELQRDLINRKSTEDTRQYGSLSDTTKLLYWYLLAQGMDAGTIVQVPDGYTLPSSAQPLLENVKSLEFQEQIALFRDYVSPMGVASESAPSNAVI